MKMMKQRRSAKVSLRGSQSGACAKSRSHRRTVVGVEREPCGGGGGGLQRASLPPLAHGTVRALELFEERRDVIRCDAREVLHLFGGFCVPISTTTASDPSSATAATEAHILPLSRPEPLAHVHQTASTWMCASCGSTTTRCILTVVGASWPRARSPCSTRLEWRLEHGLLLLNGWVRW